MKTEAFQDSNLARGVKTDIGEDVAKSFSRRPLSREAIARLAKPLHEPAPYRLIRPSPEAGMIYFIVAETGQVKIGFSRNAALRMADLQCGSPVKLSLACTVAGPPSLERQYHRRFAAHRLHGEWFARCPEIEAGIARLEDSCRRAAA